MATKTAKFLDMGDLAAQPGSSAWCLAVREEARVALKNAKSTREQVMIWIKALRDDDHFRTLTGRGGVRFFSWDDFCCTPPPHGFGMSADEVETIIAAKPLAQRLAADPDIKPLAEEGTTGRNNPTVNNINGRPQGTSAAYLVRRLKRDAPKVAAALARGEYKSARAAAMAAGILKSPDPLDVAKKAYAKLSESKRQKFMKWAIHNL